MRTILVTRPQPAADELAQKLKREGFETYVAPLMEYVDLNTPIPDLAAYQAIVFTSARSVDIFAAHEKERHLPAFCVGNATALAASKVGFSKIFSAEGDGSALAELLGSRKESQDIQRVLHVCGEDTAQDMSALLAPWSITVERCMVYKAELVETLPADVERALSLGNISTVLLMSGRTAAQFVKVMQQKMLRDSSQQLEVVCISERVAEELDPLPWRSVRVAPQPQLESILQILRDKPRRSRDPMQVDQVIDAFGGLRPLATRLGIAVSTVQGWKERGVVPEIRIERIMAAAREDGIDPSIFWKERRRREPGSAPGHEIPERRSGADRRVKHTPPDEKGWIHASTYTGPDRRSGQDRREYHTRQRQRVWYEKMRFLNRSVLTGAFFTSAIAYAIYFLFAPELENMHQDAERMKQMEARMQQMNIQLETLQTGKQSKSSFSGALNSKIEAVENAGGAVTDAVDQVADVARLVVKDTGAVDQLIRILSAVQSLSRTEEGRAAMGSVIQKLQAALGKKGAMSGDQMNKVVAMTRDQDPTLKALLADVDSKHLSAAAMLLAMNELRSNMDRQRPFKEDLKLVQRMAGDDPEMQAALQRLAPYAESGVLNRGALQQQFSGLASDIVMAKLQGEDLSVQDEALKRFQKFVKVRRVDDVTGNTVDATVARAQLMLNQGDVQGALTELKRLEGPPAQVAEPFIQQAQGSIAAEQSSDMLSQTIMQVLSSAASSGNFSMDGVVSTLKDNFGNTPIGPLLDSLPPLP